MAWKPFDRAWQRGILVAVDTYQVGRLILGTENGLSQEESDIRTAVCQDCGMGTAQIAASSYRDILRKEKGKTNDKNEKSERTYRDVLKRALAVALSAC